MILDKFLAYLHEQIENGSIYVWGGQGQKGSQITKEWIKSRETSAANAMRAIAFWEKQKAKGYKDRLRAFDCSGLGMYFLQTVHGVYKEDMSSATMYTKCASVEKASLKKGDWAFRKNNKGQVYHIGFVVDEHLNVIEAMGRDVGVVKRHIDADKGYWTHFGRPACFKAEIESNVPEPTERIVQILGDVNVRTGGSTKDNVIGVAKKGESYSCVGAASSGWHKIVFKGTTGYVSNKTDLTKRSGWTCSRIIKRTEPLMSGEDVLNVKQALVSQGYLKTATKKTFGDEAAQALKKFQKAKGLVVDGKAGKKTIPLLGGTWTGK